MAKFGFLYLNKGIWKGKRIISEAWTSNSTKKHVTFTAREGYGFQWWVKEYYSNEKSYKSFSARGWGGQVIVVLPEIDTVVVFTGGNYTENEPVDSMIVNYILPAVIS